MVERTLRRQRHRRQALPLEAYPVTAQRLLVTLKRLGTATVVELAGQLNLSEAGIRGPLGLLEASGLVAHRLVGHGPGRRRHSYELTEAGEAVFPTHSEALWEGMVVYLSREDPERLAGFWHWLAEQQRAELSSLVDPASGTLPRDELQHVYEQQKFLADVEEADDGAHELKVYHCPFLSVARDHPVICELERTMLDQVHPDSEVHRLEHQVRGDRRCVYHFVPQGA